jgi:hypothetical protein
MSARALLKLDFSERLSGRLQGKKSDSWPRDKVARRLDLVRFVTRPAPLADQYKYTSGILGGADVLR